MEGASSATTTARRRALDRAAGLREPRRGHDDQRVRAAPERGRRGRGRGHRRRARRRDAGARQAQRPSRRTTATDGTARHRARRRRPACSARRRWRSRSGAARRRRRREPPRRAPRARRAARDRRPPRSRTRATRTTSPLVEPRHARDRGRHRRGAQPRRPPAAAQHQRPGRRDRGLRRRALRARAAPTAPSRSTTTREAYYLNDDRFARVDVPGRRRRRGRAAVEGGRAHRPLRVARPPHPLDGEEQPPQVEDESVRDEGVRLDDPDRGRRRARARSPARCSGRRCPAAARRSAPSSARRRA